MHARSIRVASLSDINMTKQSFYFGSFPIYNFELPYPFPPYLLWVENHALDSRTFLR